MPTKPKKIKMPQGWKMETVTPLMRGACCSCQGIPQVVRFCHTENTIPFPTTRRFCSKCAVEAMRSAHAAMGEAINVCEKAIQGMLP